MSEIHYKIMRVSDGEDKFYSKLGKFFASKIVRKEIGGYPMDNESEWVWIVAQEKRNFNIVGFVSIAPNIKTSQFELRVFYVENEYRRQGIASTLLNKAEHFAKSEGFITVTTNVPYGVREIMERRGYKAVRERGKWANLVKEI
jgi:GNAT superfamily N-acetyltransferase